jgi:L-alanine-DL-glutamate epimerase-like enolase superfamily enzyme
VYADTIVDLAASPLNIPLKAPFVVATARLDAVENVIIRVKLSDGSVGWGEASTLPPITVENQQLALSAVESAAEWIPGLRAGEWKSIASRMHESMPDYSSTRAGIEMAIIDALVHSRHVPLYTWFGNSGDRIRTDITIPICPPSPAQALATQYAAQGFNVIKTKVGTAVADDLERLRAIRKGHPTCILVIDANEGFSTDDALAFLRELRGAGIVPGLFEQPVARDNVEGMQRLTREAGVPIAADESCRSSADAKRIARDRLAHVINVKLVKCGVAESLAVADLARSKGMGMMIGGMVESRIAIGFSAHFAAGLGGFEWIDLDTPLLLAKDPVRGGYVASGPEYDLSGIRSGHGGWIDLSTGGNEDI